MNEKIRAQSTTVWKCHILVHTSGQSIEYISELNKAVLHCLRMALSFLGTHRGVQCSFPDTKFKQLESCTKMNYCPLWARFSILAITHHVRFCLLWRSLPSQKAVLYPEKKSMWNHPTISYTRVQPSRDAAMFNSQTFPQLYKNDICWIWLNHPPNKKLQ